MTRSATCRPLLIALAGAVMVSGCVAPVGPVQVTRFHLPAAIESAQGAIRVEPGPDMDAGSIEFRTYATALEAQLQRIGYTILPQSAGAAGATLRAPQVAVLSIERRRFKPQPGRGPVSVGAGGSTGSYGSGFGVGVGINLTPPPGEQVTTEMRVSIRETATSRTLWEGRANFTVAAKSPLAQTDLGAPKVAEALFKDWPGRSGETIGVE